MPEKESKQLVLIDGIDIYQGEKRVLESVNFELLSGDWCYLLGKTGSGKSSLLKTIYAQLPIQDSSFTDLSLHAKKSQAHALGFPLNAMDRESIPRLRRQLGIIFQDFNLLTDRTVYANLDFVLRATGWKKKKSRKMRIIEVIEQVGLTEVLHSMPYQISGGEQQRVVIARALLNKPPLILADEPTGNLDPDTSNKIVELIRAVAAEQNSAVLFATHDYRIVQRYPARIVQCLDGKLMEAEVV